MAHIVDFAIDDLAGKKGQLQVNLNRGLNVFFGLNGSGKTSLLKILNSALSNDTSELVNVSFSKAVVTIWSEHYQKTYTYSLKKEREITRFPPAGTPEFDIVFTTYVEASAARSANTFRWQIEPTLEPGAVGKWAHRYLPITRLYSGPSTAGSSGTYRPLAKAPELTEEGLNRYFAESMERLWAAASTEMLSQVRQIQSDGLASILRAIVGMKESEHSSESESPQGIDLERAYKRLNAFLRRQRTKGLLGDFKQFEKKFHRDPRFRTIVSDISEVEELIEEAMIPRSELQHLIDDLFSGPKKVIFEDAAISVKGSEGSDLGLAPLSSGEKQAVKIFVEAIMAGGNVILIDEPELSLHIDWQRRLLKSILRLNSGGQLIVATHSPEVMADVDDKNIFEL